jgi:hypothetical protein
MSDRLQTEELGADSASRTTGTMTVNVTGRHGSEDNACKGEVVLVLN